MVYKFSLLVVFAYLLGSVPAAYLAGRIVKGIDIRRYASGNAGFTNVWKVVSWKAAIPVLVFDISKGALPIWIGQVMGLSFSQQLIIGTAAIVGHSWPVFLKFSGGRGIMTYLGIVLFLMPFTTIPLLIFVLLFNIGHRMSLGVIIGIFIFPVLSLLSVIPLLNGLVGRYFSTSERIPVAIAFFVLWLVIAVRRLTVPRSELAITVSNRELFINRLLFDRDIRDRNLWLSRRRNELTGNSNSNTR